MKSQKSAVEKAIANPSVVDMNKVNAQQARRRQILDCLVGLTVSPILWPAMPSSSFIKVEAPSARHAARASERKVSIQRTFFIICHRIFAI